MGKKEGWRHDLEVKMLAAFTEDLGLVPRTSGFFGTCSHMYTLTYRYKHIHN